MKNSDEKIKELLTRGVADVVDKKTLESKLKSGKKLRIKFGIDPTGPKIHIGRAVPLRKLRAFQDLGHQIVFIIGDATALIGDPSDKLSKRPMLTKEDVQKNMAKYKEQLGKIIDLKKTEFHYNSDWLKNFNFLQTAELAECFTMQQMSARRNFQERIKRNEEISVREMLYPLMQGYDSVAVKADVEIGGTDQLFNLHAGRTVQKHYGLPEQSILMTDMVEGTDGRKMSTSWGNVITIVDEPGDMFGKIMSIKDELIVKYFQFCTDVPMNEIKNIEKELKSGANPRDIKVRLAKEIVTLYHNEKEAEKAAEEFDRVFSKKEKPEDVPVYKYVKGHKLVDVLVASGLVSSKTEVRRLASQNAIKKNEKVITDIDIDIEKGDYYQVGKRRYLTVK